VNRLISNGNPATSLLQYANQATIGTAGIDVNVNWMAQLADMGIKLPGALTFNTQDSILQYYRTKQSPASIDPVIDWKGSLGPSLAGFQSGAYDYRLFTSLNYTLPSLSVSLRWRYYPEVDQIGKATENAIKKNNAKVVAGGGGTLLSYTPTTAQPTNAYSVFDLSFNWNVSSTYSIRGGIDNVLAKNPPTTGRTLGYPATQYFGTSTPLTSVCNGAPGCQNPTTYSLANSGAGTTSGGYYDTLGRQYYLGVKASF